MAVIPYDQRLGRFPAYLQQLEMESNGKRVQLDGSPANTATGPVVWGEPGTNGQHAFFQLIHQGTEIIPLDFLVAATPTEADAHHHDLLVANCLAQGQALMRGRTPEEAEALTRKQGASEAEANRLAPHKSFSGSRPTSTFLYRQLDPRTLGRLIALYEHKVFMEGAIWDINRSTSGASNSARSSPRAWRRSSRRGWGTDQLDASTAGLVAHLRALRGAGTVSGLSRYVERWRRFIAVVKSGWRGWTRPSGLLITPRILQSATDRTS